MRKGFTLLELLIGVILFSLILTMVAMGLQVSEKTIEAASRGVPVESNLQNAMDGATRTIRESKDVAGGGHTLLLTQWDGTQKNLFYSGGTLYLDASPIQGGLDDAEFVVEQWEAAKVVEVTLRASSKTLISSASLRNVPAGSPPGSLSGSSSSGSAASNPPVHYIVITHGPLRGVQGGQPGGPPVPTIPAVPPVMVIPTP